MLNLGLPLIRLEHQERLNQTSGLAGAVAVDSGARRQARPGVLRRLVRGIGDAERSRIAAADLRRIRL